ncbi:outer membrane lipoprotein-sorting protein [Cyclobacteriaceae bacterium]|nr:outer membrane lipoprotein-sorting protein [Cyclobacteriaceae bacterium]
MKKIALALIALAVGVTAFINQSEPNLSEIISKAENRMRGKSSIATMKITTVRPKYSRDMRIKNWTKTEDFNVMYIMEPARDKGTVYLKREKEIWYYLPKIERNIKMPPSMMNQSWMGTDMSNDDLVKKTSYANDFTHKLIGSVTVSGVDCYEIELIPKPDTDVVWGKIKMWVDKKLFNIMKQEQYDEDLELVNTMNASKVKSMGGETLPTHMEMIPADKKGQKTIMVYESIQFNVEIPEQYFTTQYMTRLRP